MKIVYLPILFLLILFGQSCGFDKGNCGGTPGTYYFYLKEASIKQTPYFTNKAFDTISFASDKGDTLTFVKTKTDTLWYEEPGDGSPDFGYATNRYQQIRNIYATIKGNGKFEVRHSLKMEQAFTNIISIKFNNINFVIDEAWLNPSFGYAYYIGNYPMNNKTYTNAIFAYSTLGDTTSNSIIINKDFGCIVFNDKFTNTKFYLQ